MKLKKEKLYLSNLSEVSKNPSPNQYVLVYTEIENEDEPVYKPKERVTLKQVVDMIKTMDAKMDAGFKRVDTRIDNLENRVEEGFKQVNNRLDYVVKANDLKDLPKTK